jgi:hypothetical protein
MDLLPRLTGDAAGLLSSDRSPIPFQDYSKLLDLISHLTYEAARLLRGPSATEDQVAGPLPRLPGEAPGLL